MIKLPGQPGLNGSRRNFYVTSFAAAGVVFIFFALLLAAGNSSPGTWSTFEGVGGTIHALGDQVSSWIGGSKDGLPSIEAFTKTALENDIYPEAYNGTALKELCENTVWQEGLFFTSGMIGGISNLRPGLIATVRMAIESGAGLILPRIYPRTDFAEIMKSFDFAPEHSRSIDYMFDVDHFYKTLREDCPQLILVNEVNPGEAAAWKLPDRSEQIMLEGRNLLPTWSGNVLSEPERWRETFDAWLLQNLQAKQKPPVSKAAPVRIWIPSPAFFWPSAYGGPDFSNNFGRIAISPRPVREAAARVLYRLYDRLGIRDAPDRPADARAGFLGFHLRTAADTQVLGWATYEQQRDHVVQLINAFGLRGIYVATGDQPALARFRKELAGVMVQVNDTSVPLQIFDKNDLLGDEGPLIHSILTWDQMALIDVDIMLRASKFIGIVESSFAWTLALKRHMWSTENPYDYKAHPLTFQDEYSIVFGPPQPGAFIPATLWV